MKNVFNNTLNAVNNHLRFNQNNSLVKKFMSTKRSAPQKVNTSPNNLRTQANVNRSTKGRSVIKGGSLMRKLGWGTMGLATTAAMVGTSMMKGMMNQAQDTMMERYMRDTRYNSGFKSKNRDYCSNGGT